ncbi:MAG TPA: DNA-processing protein DprA [Solirubrobacteraceae bacterium]|nr:DNA-processing protein DprA [Solirubrobacteraceae bacterium]
MSDPALALAASPLAAAADASPAPLVDRACDACLRRSWLLAALVEHFERSSPRRSELSALLALADGELIRALGGRDVAVLRERHREFAPGAMRLGLRAFGLHVVCVHDAAYPPLLAEAPDRPAALFVAGAWERFASLAFGPTVALVGARRASGYGLEAAGALGRDLAAAGVAVVSGMALGVDSAAHSGALDAGGATVAVLAGSAHRPYPASKRRLHGRIVSAGCVVSEQPPGAAVRRWSFPARNRIIAGLAQATVVVEASVTSGSLITAECARALGRDVGAVPGQVTSPLAAGPNDLLFDGALVVRGAGDVLDLLFGAGARPPARRRDGSELSPRLRDLLGAVERGRTTLAAIVAAGADAGSAMVGLAELELHGYVRRGPAGSYVRVP